MADFISIELPYQADSSVLFSKLRHLPWAVYLDSCQPYSQQGRYDILTAFPYIKLITQAQQTFIHRDDGVEISNKNPFILLKDILNKVNNTLKTSPLFAGGAIGYFAYDLARRVETIPARTINDINLPEMAVGIYDWAIVIDHQLKKTSLFSYQQHPDTPKLLKQLIVYLADPFLNTSLHSLIEERSFQLLSAFQANFTKKEYAKAFQRIQDYLQAGDCYQVNLAQRFTASYQGDEWQAYQTLRQHNAAPYAAFLKQDAYTVMSLSPELFLSCHSGIVETKPIKGTRPRGVDNKQDQQLANELSQSHKDKAENLMIVDLLRNDLGKICQPGSVKTTDLFAIESFPAVHHMVSTITGELAKDKSSVDLLTACFPGGSITGAPKLRAMEIIEELEPEHRSVYCGAIGYIDFNGNMDVNIAIRTLIAAQGKLHCYAGGGIVADSNCKMEYQETYDKVAKILGCLIDLSKIS